MGAALCGGQEVTPELPDPGTPVLPPVVVLPDLPAGQGLEASLLPLLPGVSNAPRLFEADLRDGSPDGPPAWLLLSPWRREEEEP
jgi:hypothetical protein